MLYTKYIYNYHLLFLVCFTLPMYIRLNSIILGLFIILSIITSFNKNHKSKPYFLKVYIPVLVFFALALIGSLIGEDPSYFKSLEKYWSFLLVPIAFWLINLNSIKLKHYAFYGLITGCIATLLICYINAIYEIIAYQEPISYFLRWRHLSHRFTLIADTHPAYLGLFICTSTFYLLFNAKKLNNILKIIILVFFFFGMLQLASRLALFIFLIIFLIYILSLFKTNLKFAIVGTLIVSIASILYFSKGSYYLNQRLLSSESVTSDSRFERLDVYFEIFDENLLFGTGLKSIDKIRINKYKQYNQSLAADKNYNAHNQFVEYLALNGIVGGIVYMGVFIYLIMMSIKDRNYLFIFIITAFFVANLTESMLVRIKGIEYFSVFISLFLKNRFIKKST